MWPRLVLASVCRVPAVVTLTGALGFDGAPQIVKTIDTTCYYSGKGRWQFNDFRFVQSKSTALFPGDLAPELPCLTGWVEVAGQCLVIETASRARNPDGSVNFTRLELR